MSVTGVEKDPARRTMTVTAEYPSPVERVWRLWSDPRLLERWWGPPTYPATFEEHDLVPGGSVTYFMTGPGGDRHRGWWRITSVEPPHRLEFEDGFADGDGVPAANMPVSLASVALIALPDGGTRMTITFTFPSSEAMEQMLGMGMEEGLVGAIGQIDALLAEGATG